jgi:hypothetical protein
MKTILKHYIVVKTPNHAHRRFDDGSSKSRDVATQRAQEYQACFDQHEQVWGVETVTVTEVTEGIVWCK